MYIKSLRTGKCFSQHCRYRHIKGTARHEKDGERNVNRTKSTPKEHSESNSPNSDQRTSPSNTSDHFLEAIRLLKAELLQEIAQIRTQVQQPYSNQQMLMNAPQQYPMPQGIHHVPPTNQMYPPPILRQTPTQISSQQPQQNQLLINPQHPQHPTLAINQAAPQRK